MRLNMEILSSGKFNIPAPTLPTNNHVNAPQKLAEETQPGVHVSISQEAREKHDAELKQTEKVSADEKDDDETLRLDGSKLNSSKTEKKDLSPEEKLEQRIEEVKEKIKEVQKEIQALSTNDSEQAEKKIKILNLQMQALLGELNSLMEQKIELMKKGKG